MQILTMLLILTGVLLVPPVVKCAIKKHHEHRLRDMKYVLETVRELLDEVRDPTTAEHLIDDEKRLLHEIEVEEAA